MLYTELIQLWDEAVRAVDNRDWDGALAKLIQISEPTSRTLFVNASVHLALGQLEEAIKALDQVIAKDERLAVGFFQRAAVHMMAGRLEEALGDCIWAQKHMRANAVIDYKQLGLRYRLYSWQVLYNAAAVHCRQNQWNKATEILQAALQEGGGKGGQVDSAMQKVAMRELIAPLLVPEGVVFRPRKQYVEELKPRDFLGKAEVIISNIPNDDFGGFEPLRLQKPGYYEPQVEEGQDSRYMYVKKAYFGRNATELTVPAGAYVYVFSEEDKDGFVTVIFDGQRGLLPNFLLETVKKKTKDKKKMESKASGIPHPPSMKPPTRPQVTGPPIPELPSLYTSSTQTASSTDDSSTALSPNVQQMTGADSVVVKVHYTYTIALSVPIETPYRELQERIAQKLGQPAELIRLRYKQHGSTVLTPLEEDGGVRSLGEVAEAGRATLWCQAEDPLANRTILYHMVALYDYTAQGPEDLEFSEGDTIDILSEVNEEWLEGHTAGTIGIFPRCFAYRDSTEKVIVSEATPEVNVK
ncbi:NADPH oxidase activator 1 isoform X1 [Tachysurus fulvidraco]|uniref:NADPH oxidase activator 1 isoform X1 n=1 Tax=Tachysurus fulvidraco TaxID=1234273 RepID=UPI000F4D6D16|nr:NADPH oxidase activator 1 isoform X1 [Tachysurus fulvidraco]XP_027018504.1 NADPH oxidase activator 1 isoform X1 [Tachysurus fulvidraco]